MGPEDVRVRIAYCGVGGLDPYIITGEIPLELPWHNGLSGYRAFNSKNYSARRRQPEVEVGDRVAWTSIPFALPATTTACMTDRISART
jgi:hypothetical protein